MHPQLRERLGQAAYEQSSLVEKLTWGNTSEEIREEYRNIAEAVARELAQVTLPAFQHMAFALTGKQVDVHFEENT